MKRMDWPSTIPFALVHAGCFLAPWTGVSATAAVALALTYALRAFGVTAGYHRYFAHRSFATGPDRIKHGLVSVNSRSPDTPR